MRRSTAKDGLQIAHKNETMQPQSKAMQSKYETTDVLQHQRSKEKWI
jgi:hypothetical protein